VTKVDWVAVRASLRVVCAAWSFLSAVGVPSEKSSSQWEEGPVPEEMSQNLLTNKQVKMRLQYAANIVKPA
jgi:hypothetical protein